MPVQFCLHVILFISKGHLGLLQILCRWIQSPNRLFYKFLGGNHSPQVHSVEWIHQINNLSKLKKFEMPNNNDDNMKTLGTYLTRTHLNYPALILFVTLPASHINSSWIQLHLPSLEFKFLTEIVSINNCIPILLNRIYIIIVRTPAPSKILTRPLALLHSNFEPKLVSVDWYPIVLSLSLIHIWRCRRSTLCRSRWSPYH